MASYILRDVNGVARAKFDAERAKFIMDGADGHFRSWTAANGKTVGKTVTAFEMDDDGKYSIGGVEVFLWKGEVLIPC